MVWLFINLLKNGFPKLILGLNIGKNEEVKEICFVFPGF